MAAAASAAAFVESLYAVTSTAGENRAVADAAAVCRSAERNAGWHAQVFDPTKVRELLEALEPILKSRKWKAICAAAQAVRESETK